MSNKLLSIILLFVGLITIIVFLGADLLGLGNDPNAFGWKQITGTATGLLLFLAGIWFRRNKPQ